MDPSSAGLWMLMTTVGLPAAFGVIDAWRNGRGLFGWIVSLAASLIGGIGLMLAVVNLARIPFSEGNASTPPPTEIIAFAQIFGGLILGAMLALWMVNRVRD
jgi:hypothetical protein